MRTHYFSLRTIVRVSYLFLTLYVVHPQKTQAQNVTVSAQSVGANVDETQASATLFVDQNDPLASDSNTGIEVSPLKTIGAAVSQALTNNGNGTGTRILINPGIYRERLDLIGNGSTSGPPIILQAQTPGSVVLAGSDVWPDWAPSDGGTYTHSWPYRWGLAPYPDGWEGAVSLADIVRRREMIFVNGTSMTEVLEQGSLRAGSFFVDEQAGTVVVEPLAQTDMSSAVVEVSTRTDLLNINGMQNVVVRGIVFRHENSFLESGGPLQIINSANILVDGCQFVLNSAGLGILTSDRITVRETTSNSNGFSGMAGYHVTNSLFTDNETSYNNWRGEQGNFLNWSTAGARFLLAHHDVFQRHKATGNYAVGFWLDTDNVDVLIQQCTLENNLLDGVFFEATEGPVQLTSNTVDNNGGSGVFLGNTAGTLVNGNTVFNNAGPEVMTSGDPGGRWVQNFETGQVYPNNRTSNLTLTGNVIYSGNGAQSLMGTTLDQDDWGVFLGSLVSDQNQWFNAGTPIVFQIVNGQLETLPQWQNTTGQDSHSLFISPTQSSTN
jgi:parallel beta-helix repeat protein